MQPLFPVSLFFGCLLKWLYNGNLERFNRVGDKYIDITFEFALELDPTQYEYVAFGEYPEGVIEEITNQTGYYGDIYRFCYCAAQMALEKMNPRT